MADPKKGRVLFLEKNLCLINVSRVCACRSFFSCPRRGARTPNQKNLRPNCGVFCLGWLQKPVKSTLGRLHPIGLPEAGLGKAQAFRSQKAANRRLGAVELSPLRLFRRPRRLHHRFPLRHRIHRVRHRHAVKRHRRQQPPRLFLAHPKPLRNQRLVPVNRTTAGVGYPVRIG